MKRLVLLATALIFALSVGVALAMDPPAGDISIDSGGGKKGAVTFNHAKHKDAKCEDCHHAAKDGKFKCTECHKAEGTDVSSKDAMHKKDAGKCYSCHVAKDAAQKKKCADCHG